MLKYRKYAFYRINEIKKNIRKSCQINTIIWTAKSSNFDFPK